MLKSISKAINSNKKNRKIKIEKLNIIYNNKLFFTIRIKL